MKRADFLARLVAVPVVAAVAPVVDLIPEPVTPEPFDADRRASLLADEYFLTGSGEPPPIGTFTSGDGTRWTSYP